MSNRNFDASTIIKIMKAQNAANGHNRYQTLENSSVNQLQPNPQARHYDADVVNEYNAGSQAYYFKGVPTTTVVSPEIFPPIAPTILPSNPPLPRAAIQELIDTQSTAGIESYINTYGLTTSLIGFRSVLKNTESLEQRGAALARILSTVNGGTTTIIPVTSPADIKGLIDTFDTVNDVNPPDPTKPIYTVIPAFTTNSSPYTATIDLETATYNGSSYASIIELNLATLVFELPVSVSGAEYQLTLTYNGSSMTLTYDGTVLIDKDTQQSYSATDTLFIAGLVIPLIGLGSFGSSSPNSSGASSSDFGVAQLPVTTINSVTAGGDSTITITSSTPYFNIVNLNGILGEFEDLTTDTNGKRTDWNHVACRALIFYVNGNFFSQVDFQENGSIGERTLTNTYTLKLPPCIKHRISIRAVFAKKVVTNYFFVSTIRSTPVYSKMSAETNIINTQAPTAPVITGLEINYSTVTINFTPGSKGCGNNASVALKITGSLNYSIIPAALITYPLPTSGIFRINNFFTESVQVQLITTTDNGSSVPSNTLNIIPNPVITSLVPGPNSLTVNFTVPTSPIPYSKFTFYSDNAGNTITNVSTDVTIRSFTIRSLNILQSYTVTMKTSYRVLFQEISSPLSNPMAAIPTQLPAAPSIMSVNRSGQAVTFYFYPGYQGSSSYKTASWTTDGVNYNSFPYLSHSTYTPDPDSYTFTSTASTTLQLQLITTTDAGSSPPSTSYPVPPYVSASSL
uniref:Fibronectin type-III domain-containing protein n=1 Tax=viral metagenome TaxID=1070528 RepID=A0A6C0DGY5_9ZZZZ